jgi:hypothetical protein
MPSAPLAAEHKELSRLIDHDLHLLSEHLDEVAGIPGDYSDPQRALLARLHEDLRRIQSLLERVRHGAPAAAPPRALAMGN